MPLTRKLVGTALACALVATACTSDNEDTSGAAAEARSTEPAATEPAIATAEPPSAPDPTATATAPPSQPNEPADDTAETRLLAGVNVAIADVPLEDIVFDTFDGGSVSLAEATEAQIVALLNAIPPIDAPVYIEGATATWLTDADIVLGYVGDDGTSWAHPHRVLNFHEIINTTVAGRPIAITYCPLCGSGVVFDRRPNDLRHDGVLTFDNTSALYENDMVMVDAETHTYWWQVSGRGIVGNLTGTELTPLPATTTSWATWLATHPDTMVLSDDQGAGPRYAFDPFVDYAAVIDAGRLAFPVSAEAFADERLAPSTRVIGFEHQGSPAAVSVLANTPTVITIGGSATEVVLLDGGGGGGLFDTTVDGTPATFTATESDFVDDVSQSTWNLAGLAVAGPLEGTQLTQLPSRTAYWFAWVSTTDGEPSRLFTPDGER